jgi:hypothetical protein
MIRAMSVTGRADGFRLKICCVAQLHPKAATAGVLLLNSALYSAPWNVILPH